MDKFENSTVLVDLYDSQRRIMITPHKGVVDSVEVGMWCGEAWHAVLVPKNHLEMALTREDGVFKGVADGEGEAS